MGQNRKTHQQDKSPKIPQRDKIDWVLKIKERGDLTEKQLAFLELTSYKETKLVFVDGPAGCSKTFLSVLAGLREMNIKHIGELFYVRTIIESATKSIGALPGEIGEKFGPFLIPLQDKLEELLFKPDIDRLHKENRIKTVPINFLRGASFNATFLVADEIQNFSFGEIQTLITRQGEYSKFILCGDSMQQDLGGKSGFKEMWDIFNTEECQKEGIYCVKFDSSDIVRSGLVKFIVERLEEHAKSKLKK
jgi:phosphate starvation-inducible PhoH-like protein